MDTKVKISRMFKNVFEKQRRMVLYIGVFKDINNIYFLGKALGEFILLSYINQVYIYISLFAYMLYNIFLNKNRDLEINVETTFMKFDSKEE